MNRSLQQFGEVTDVVQRLKEGDQYLCSRLITLVENRDKEITTLLQLIYKSAPNTPVIGITGPPGAGKSTLVSELIFRYRKKDKKIAVLAIDPSSPVTGGAILGDRIRMLHNHVDDGTYIRSMSSRGSLGGLSKAVGNALLILSAMDFDVIFLETVGVGQNEIDIIRYAQTVVILQTPAGGDGVQAIKAGLLEVGDIFAVNKSDLPGANKTVSDIKVAIKNRSADSPWKHPVFAMNALKGEIDLLVEAIENHTDFLRNNPTILMGKRREQVSMKIEQLVKSIIAEQYFKISQECEYKKCVDKVVAHEKDIYTAAEFVLKSINVSSV